MLFHRQLALKQVPSISRLPTCGGICTQQVESLLPSISVFLALLGLIHSVNFRFSCDCLTTCGYFGVWFIKQPFFVFVFVIFA